MQPLPADAPVAVLGAGRDGEGIAEVAARAGHPVRLFDPRPESAGRAVDAVRGRLARDVGRGRSDATAAAAVAARLTVAADLAALEGCRLVVEAAGLDRAAGRDLLRAAEDVVDKGVDDGADDVLLATAGRAVPVTALGAALRRPDRFVGLHFPDPARRTPLVEVVRGDATSAAAVDAGCELVRAWGRTPVVCAATPGFVVDRVSRAFFGEAQRVVELGAADPATVDAVLCGAGGFPVGPFALADRLGQDVDLAVTRTVWEQTFHDPRYAPTVFQARLVDAGRLGRAAGRGVYAYEGGQPLDAEPQTAPPRRAPRRVEVRDYDFGPMGPFLDRVAAGGVEVEHVTLTDDEVFDELPGLRLPGDGLLRVTDGSTARSWTLEAPGGVVLLDWANDPAGCTRVALMAPRDVEVEVLDAAIGLCQAAGVEVSVVGDVAGGIVARTVAMLVNEAVDLVARGEAAATDVDVAMLLGTGYPSGPLEWGDRVGGVRVAAVLGELGDETPTGRYRVSPRLDEAIIAEENLRDL